MPPRRACPNAARARATTSDRPRIGIGKRQILDLFRQPSRRRQRVVDLLATAPGRTGNDQPRGPIGIDSAATFDRFVGRVVAMIDDQDQFVVVVILLEQRTQVIGQSQVQTAARHDDRRPPTDRLGRRMAQPAQRITAKLVGLRRRSVPNKPPQPPQAPDTGPPKNRSSSCAPWPLVLPLAARRSRTASCR